MSLRNDKTAIIDAPTLEDFTPDNWEDQPTSNANAPQKEVPPPRVDQQPMTSQRVEILRNEDKANEAKPSIREETKEHLSVEDRLKRYNEARARIFRDNKKVG